MPRRSIRFAAKAERWLLKFIADVAEDNPITARQFLIRLENFKENLALFPEMTERGLIPGTRRIVLRPLILTARIREDVVEIIAIRQERQKDARAPSDIDPDGDN